MSEIQRRDFLTGAAAATTAAILAGAGRAEVAPPETGDQPPEPIRGNEGAAILGPANPARQPRARTGSGRRLRTTARCRHCDGPLPTAT